MILKLETFKKYKGCYFFSESAIKIKIKFTHIEGTSFTKYREFFTVSFIINTLCPSLRQTLYAGRVKIFVKASKPSVSDRRRPQNGILGVHPTGRLRDGSRRMLNGECRENKGEKSTKFLQMPPLCSNCFVACDVMPEEDVIKVWPKMSNSFFFF